MDMIIPTLSPLKSRILVQRLSVCPRATAPEGSVCGSAVEKSTAPEAGRISERCFGAGFSTRDLGTAKSLTMLVEAPMF